MLYIYIILAPIFQCSIVSAELRALCHAEVDELHSAVERDLLAGTINNKHNNNSSCSSRSSSSSSSSSSNDSNDYYNNNNNNDNKC